MSGRQGGKAAASRDAFALCVVPLTEEQIDPSTIRQAARFVPDIGDRLKERVDTINALQELVAEATISADDVDVLVDGSEIHYRVKQPVWTSGLDFGEFVDFLLHFFGAVPSDH